MYKTVKGNQRQAVLYAYFAGLFDGEGTIRINKVSTIKDCLNPRYAPAISIGMSDEKIMNLFAETFGGKLRIECVLNRKVMYRWGTSGRKIVPQVIRKLLPYLQVKKEQANLVIDFCEKGKWRREKKTKCLKCKNNSLITAYGLCMNCSMQERRANTLDKWKKNKQIKSLPIQELQWRERIFQKVKKLNAVGAAATTK